MTGMTSTTAPPGITAGAREVARTAAARAGVELRELDDLDGIVAASELFDLVWTDPAQTIMPVNLIRALSAAGNYVAGAYADQRMVGAIVGFVGLHDGEMVVHSHILGVLPQMRGRSAGYALKLHQRAWCLDRDVRTVLWTFDPLVRRNAYLNLAKLGAVGARYETNFYGTMNDGINAGDETDRMVAAWHLLDDRVIAATQGRSGAPAEAGDAAVMLDADEHGAPVLRHGTGDVRRCRVPDDIVALRETQPELALQWRHALRDTLGAAVADGYQATGMDRDGWYTLTRPAEA